MKEQLERIRKQDFSSLDQILFQNIMGSQKLNNTYLQIKQLNGVVSQLTLASQRGTQNHRYNIQNKSSKLTCHQCLKRTKQLVKVKQQLRSLKQSVLSFNDLKNLWVQTHEVLLKSVREAFNQIYHKLQVSESQRVLSNDKVMELQKINHELNLKQFNLEKNYGDWEEQKNKRSLSSIGVSRYKQSINFQSQIQQGLADVTNFSSNKYKTYLSKPLEQVFNYKAIKTEHQKISQMSINRALNSKLNTREVHNRNDHEVVRKPGESRKNSCRKLKVFSNI